MDPVQKIVINTKKPKKKPKKKKSANTLNIPGLKVVKKNKKKQNAEKYSTKDDSDFERPPFPKKDIEWYNIFSQVKNSFQADLMFMNYKDGNQKKVSTILSMININTRYMLAAVVGNANKGTIIRDVDAEDDENEWAAENLKTKKETMSENKQIVNDYKTRKNRNFGQKTALQTSKGLQKILDSLPQEKEKLFKYFNPDPDSEDSDSEEEDSPDESEPQESSDEGETDKEDFTDDEEDVQPTDLDIDRIFVDEGTEFMKEFNKKCIENGISLHVFEQKKGSKRRLGIIERSHRILRKLLLSARKNALARGENLSYADLLPDVLDEYNYRRDHKSLRKYVRRFSKGKQHLDYGIKIVPAYMYRPGEEEKYIKWMEGRQKKLDKKYEETYKKLEDPNIEVKYWKRDYEKAMKNSTVSTLSKRRKVKGRHKYVWMKKDEDDGKFKQKKMIGRSIELENEPSRFMPYELRIKKKKTKK